MKMYVGSDHRGHAYKEKIIRILEDAGHRVIDAGTHEGSQSCDYPKIAQKVAVEVAKSKNNRGVLICMSGIGQAIAANKVRGAYAALCYTAETASLSRRHNNANILVLGAKFVKEKDLKNILSVWLTTPFEGGRHKRRFEQIRKIEKGSLNDVAVYGVKRT